MSVKPLPSAVVPRGPGLLSLVIASAWIIGFSVWFHTFDLPNNHVPRSLVWRAIPLDFMDLLDPPVQRGEVPWSWMFLFQRLPFLFIAIAIWSGAWGQGSLILRFLKIRLSFCEQL